MLRKLIDTAEVFKLSHGNLPQYIQNILLKEPFCREIVYDRIDKKLLLFQGIPEEDLESLISQDYKDPDHQAIMRKLTESYKERRHKNIELIAQLETLADGLQQFIMRHADRAQVNQGVRKKVDSADETWRLLRSNNRAEVIQALKKLLIIIPAFGYDYAKDISALLALQKAWGDVEARQLIDKILARYYKKNINKLIQELGKIETSSAGAVKAELRPIGQNFLKGLRSLFAEAADEKENLLQDPAAVADYAARLLNFFRSPEYNYVIDPNKDLAARLQKITGLLQSLLSSRKDITAGKYFAAQAVSLRDLNSLNLLRWLGRRGEITIRVAGAEEQPKQLFVNNKQAPFYWRWLAQLAGIRYWRALNNLAADLDGASAALVPYVFATGAESCYRTFVLYRLP